MEDTKIIEEKNTNEEIKEKRQYNKKNKDENNNDKALENLEKENKDKDEKIEQLMKSMQIMQEQLLKMQVNQIYNNAPEDDDEKEIMVGCRAFSGCVLSTIDNSVKYSFTCGEEKPIIQSDLKQLFKPNGYNDFRKLFQSGIFYFVNEDDYKKFKIKKAVDLSIENIKRILFMEDTNKMLTEINNLTNNLYDRSIVHTLQYEIALLLAEGKLKNWSYENRERLESYFKIKFDELRDRSGMMKAIIERNRNITITR